MGEKRREKQKAYLATQYQTTYVLNVKREARCMVTAWCRLKVNPTLKGVSLFAHPITPITKIGRAGTGKSRVLHAFATWDEQQADPGRYMIGAFTGTAASIVRGTTIHRLFGITPANSERRYVNLTSRRDPTKMDARVKSARLLIIDEVSMISHELHNDIHNKLTKLLACEDGLDYGGMNMVFVGDFLQFGPVAGTPWYQSPLSAKRDLMDYSQGLTDVVVLTENMRQKDDEDQLADLAYAVRTKTVTQEQYSTLESRLVSRLGPGCLAEGTGDFNGYTTLVPRHDLRVDINKRKALSTSATLGVPLLVYEVQYEPQRDRLTPMPIAGNIPHAFKRHSCMEPVLYMFPGMDCVININQAISQGATNGAPATVVQIVLDGRDQHAMFPQTSSTGQDIRILRHPPAYVVVQLQNDNPNLYDSKGLLPPKCIVMKPKSATYSPPKRGIHSPGEKIKGWKFSQIPISPAFAITEICSQGATMSKVLLDMNWRGTTASSSVQTYVGMTRAKRLKDVAFLSLKKL